MAGAAAREAELEAKSRQLAEAKAGLEAKASELSCRCVVAQLNSLLCSLQRVFGGC